MRPICCLLLILLAMPAAAGDLTLERIFADPSLAGSTPRGVKVSPDGRRVGLLRGRPTDRHQLDLWTYDVKTGRLEMRVDSVRLAPKENLSDAERARRERERTADYHGIVDYDWAPDGRHVLFTLGGNLYLYDLDVPADAALRRLTHATQPVIDPQMSPRGRYVSFVRDQDLWVIDLEGGDERRLTADGGGTIHNAEAEFVAQEELMQTSGYWWAPDDSAIVYKRFDDSAVPIARRTEIYADRTEMVEQRYPVRRGSQCRRQAWPGRAVRRRLSLGRLGRRSRHLSGARRLDAGWPPVRLPAPRPRSEAARPYLGRCRHIARDSSGLGDVGGVGQFDG